MPSTYARSTVQRQWNEIMGSSFREHMRCIYCKRGKYGVGHNWICKKCREVISNGYDPYTKCWNDNEQKLIEAKKAIEEYEKERGMK